MRRAPGWTGSRRSSTRRRYSIGKQRGRVVGRGRCAGRRRRAVVYALDRIEDAAHDGQWAVVSSESWTGGARPSKDNREVRDGAAADLALLKDRRRLRGLLDAYIARARALGRLEEAGVGQLLAAAQDELYQAPTDLDHATELLQQLQRALAVSTEAAGP